MPERQAVEAISRISRVIGINANSDSMLTTTPRKNVFLGNQFKAAPPCGLATRPARTCERAMGVVMRPHVKVTNVETGKSGVVVINDHLSAHAGGGIIIDISQRACKELGFGRGGEAKIKLEVQSRAAQHSLVYSAHDEEHNDGIVLEKVLLEETSKAQDD
jgi:hypothetical protein